MTMLKPGDRVNALYLSRKHGTCLTPNRKVLTVTPRPDGQYLITVDLPDEAVYLDGEYIVGADGRSDYIDRYNPAEWRRNRGLA